VRDIIRDLRKAGVAVFLNSHLLGEVEATCDRVVFIKQGRVVHELPLTGVEETFEVSLRVAGLDAETRAGLARFGAGVQANGTAVRLRVSGEERLPEIADWIVSRGGRLYEMRAG